MEGATIDSQRINKVLDKDLNPKIFIQTVCINENEDRFGSDYQCKRILFTDLGTGLFTYGTFIQKYVDTATETFLRFLFFCEENLFLVTLFLHFSLNTFLIIEERGRRE